MLRLARLPVPLAAALLVLLAVPPAAVAQAPATDERPNIVLVLTDDQRWDTLWAMPTVQRELVEPGVRFSEAFVVNPLCCPSRASILTGQYSHSTGVYLLRGSHGGFRAFRDGSTIATWLQAGGYRTGLVGKYMNGYRGTYVPPGWNRWVAFSGTPQYYNYWLNVDGVMTPRGSQAADYSTDALTSEAASFIRETDGPLFLYFAPYAPHGPIRVAPRHAGSFAGLEPWRPPSYNEADVWDKPLWLRSLPPVGAAGESALDAFRRDQLASLLAVDDAVGAIVDALRDTDRLRNTLIVFTSDNGFAWGEHRFRGKRVPYEESIRVPFVVRYDALLRPGGSGPALEDPPPRGAGVDVRPVLNIDLAPTFAAAAGVPASPVDGQSLVPLLDGSATTWRRDFLVENLATTSSLLVPTYCALRNEQYTYVQYVTGEEELYDLLADPYQLQNRATDPSLRTALVRARSRLSALCTPRPPGLRLKSPCLVEGTRGKDALAGTPHFDLICAKRGSDWIAAGADADVVLAGAGSDDVYGGSGADRITGGHGRDAIFGGGGDDQVFPRDGARDVVRGGSGVDAVVADAVDVGGVDCESATG